MYQARSNRGRTETSTDILRRIRHGFNKIQTLPRSTPNNLRSTQLEFSRLCTLVNDRRSSEEFVKRKLFYELSPCIWRGFVLLDVGCSVAFIMKDLQIQLLIVRCTLMHKT